MGFLLYGFFYYLAHPLSLLLLALGILHFIRRRPDTYWLWVILLLGPIGAAVYLVAEALPDIGLLRGTMKVFPRRKRIRELERLVYDNPAAGNYEELGDLYMEDGRIAQARAAFDAFYRRGACALELGDAAAAIPDLEKVVDKEAGYDFYRAAGLLAHAYAKTGQTERAEALFRQVTARSVASETYLNLRSCWRRRGRPPRRASGRRRCWTRSRICRDICGVGNGRGSGVRISY
jgi:hypothetical protein